MAVSTAAGKPRTFPMLVVSESGGFVPVEYNFTRLPKIVLLSDGRMITRSEIYPAVYPGPAVQTLLVKNVGNSIPRIASALKGTQLVNPKFDWGFPGVADVTNTDVTSKFQSQVRATSVSVYALDFPGFGLTDQQAKERKRASKLLNDLQAFSNKYIFTKSLPTVWISDRWAYQVREAVPNELSTTRNWFGSALTKPVACAMFTKTETAILLKQLSKINQATVFKSGGKLWSVALRPLLPHETGCSSLK